MELVAAPPTPCGLLTSNGRSTSLFIGNYIHNSSPISWHHHKRQRPSKYTRQQVKIGKKVLEERQVNRHLSESGYETIGEANAGKETYNQSNLPTNNCPSNSTVQKLLKDLHRCDVFIARSLSALQEVSRIQWFSCGEYIALATALYRWREGYTRGVFSATSTLQGQRE